MSKVLPELRRCYYRHTGLGATQPGLDHLSCASGLTSSNINQKPLQVWLSFGFYLHNCIDLRPIPGLLSLGERAESTPLKLDKLNLKLVVWEFTRLSFADIPAMQASAFLQTIPATRGMGWGCFHTAGWITWSPHPTTSLRAHLFMLS